LYFDDLGEIDEICLQALKRQSLLPPSPAEVRIERFVEKQFRTALRYEELGPDILGCTIFNSSGAVDAIVVSRSLEEQNTTPARRRVRSTVAHEAGHGLLHGSLFIGDNFVVSGADLFLFHGNKKDRILERLSCQLGTPWIARTTLEAGQCGDGKIADGAKFSTP
jgi:hypothetical protein